MDKNRGGTRPTSDGANSQRATETAQEAGAHTLETVAMQCECAGAAHSPGAAAKRTRDERVVARRAQPAAAPMLRSRRHRAAEHRVGLGEPFGRCGAVRDGRQAPQSGAAQPISRPIDRSDVAAALNGAASSSPFPTSGASAGTIASLPPPLSPSRPSGDHAGDCDSLSTQAMQPIRPAHTRFRHQSKRAGCTHPGKHLPRVRRWDWRAFCDRDPPNHTSNPKNLALDPAPLRTPNITKLWI